MRLDGCGLTWRLATLAVGVIVLLGGCGDDGDDEESEPAIAEPPPYSYSGDTGPSNWGEIDPLYAECASGERQSPIDLTDGSPSTEPVLALSYEPEELELINNGHSVEAEYPDGSSITLDGALYVLIQFHFHAPAEHQIDGRSFPIEFHFVNEAEDGTKAVLGVMGVEGKENQAFSRLVEAIPTQKDATAEVEGEVDAAKLLPPGAASASRWSYEGSLTTPPCTEGVRWIVFNRPIELSAEQIAAFTAAYEGNNRPLQELNGREVLLVEGE